MKKSEKVHGDKYDYLLVEYKTSHEKVSIVCKEHVAFNQKDNGHLNGKGCPTCAGNIKLTTKDFINKINVIHGNKYDYSLVKYTKNKNKVKIVCPNHGVFEQSPKHSLKPWVPNMCR